MGQRSLGVALGALIVALAPAPAFAGGADSLPACRPVPRPVSQPVTQAVGVPPAPDSGTQLVQYQGGGLDSGTSRDPSQLKQIIEIMPFADYEPDAQVRREDPHRFQCPPPGAIDCEDEGGFVRCPEEVRLADEPFMPRLMPPSVFAWEASNIWYYPLYFEDVQLERYGHTHHELIQPFDSAGLFALQLLGLPYQMTLDPPCKKIYPLGYYRPGECAPKLKYQIPLNCKAAFNQAAVTTGMFYIFP